MAALRIIIDTNILIGSAMDEDSAEARLIRLVLAGYLKPLITNRIRRENTKIIRRKFRNEDPEARKTLERVFLEAEEVQQKSNLRGITEDRDDDKFIEAAVDGDADYIITNDHHLLDLHNIEGTEILTARDFLQAYFDINPNLKNI
ncbi:putative toxin-antitoxin system toxin component, PIN family [Patescibacteria group bacterium]